MTRKTFSELQDDFSYAIVHDTSLVADTEAKSILNRAYAETMHDLGIKDVQTTDSSLTGDASTTTFNVPTAVKDKEIVDVYVGTTHYTQVRPDQVSEMPDYSYYIWADQMIFNAAPATGTIYIKYGAAPATLTDNDDEPVIAADFQDMIVTKACELYYLDYDASDTAQNYAVKYDKRLEQYHTLMNQNDEEVIGKSVYDD